MYSTVQHTKNKNKNKNKKKSVASNKAKHPAQPATPVLSRGVAGLLSLMLLMLRLFLLRSNVSFLLFFRDRVRVSRRPGHVRIIFRELCVPSARHHPPLLER